MLHYIYMYVYMYLCVCVYVYLYICMCMFFIYLSTCLCIDPSIYVCVYVDVFMGCVAAFWHLWYARSVCYVSKYLLYVLYAMKCL